MNEDIEPFLLKYYDIIEKVYTGSNSIIWKVIDKISNKVYALRKVAVLFRYLIPMKII